MVEKMINFSESEKQYMNEMLFTLSDRDKGTFAVVVTASEKKQKALYDFLKDHLKEYRFYDLNLPAYSYTSLYRALQELLPAEIQQSTPVQYLVNITGLENSLFRSQEANVKISALVSQLNFERELLFSQPYIILLWTGGAFDRELRKKAPDLMHWVSKHFVFEEDGETGKWTVSEPEITYGAYNKKEKQQRQERIKQLLQTLEKLSHHSDGKPRVIRDKINLLVLLSKEFRSVPEPAKAAEAIKKAISLNSKNGAGLDMQLYFEMALTFFDDQKYDEALSYYSKAMDIAEQVKDMSMLCNIYYEKGRVYSRQQKWKDALSNLQKVLELQKTEEDEYTTGNTFHQIGMVYAQQGKWYDALLSFQKALELQRTNGDDTGTGSTYYQMGRIFEETNRLKEAAEFFERAVQYLSKSNHLLKNNAGIALTRVQERIKEL